MKTLTPKTEEILEQFQEAIKKIDAIEMPIPFLIDKYEINMAYNSLRECKMWLTAGMEKLKKQIEANSLEE